MSVGLWKFARDVKHALTGPPGCALVDVRGGGKGYFLAGQGHFTHEVVRLDRKHSALAFGSEATSGAVLTGGSASLGPRIQGRDFLARLLETRHGTAAHSRIEVHIAGACIGYLPPSLSTIYAEWAADWRLSDTLILCKARVMVRRQRGANARAVPQVMLDIARPFQIRAFSGTHH